MARHGIIGISPTPLNGAANFWNNAQTATDATISAKNGLVPQFYAGAIIQFNSFASIDDGFHFGSPTGAGNIAINSIAVNASATYGNGADNASQFAPVLGGTVYTYTAPNVVYTGPTPPGTLIQLPARLESANNYGMTVDLTNFSDFTFLHTQYLETFTNSGINTQLSIFSNGTAQFNFVQNLTSIASAILPVVNGDQLEVRTTTTAYEGYLNSILQFSIARVKANTVTGGLLGTIGNYPSNAMNSVDTTGLAPGLYTLNVNYMGEGNVGVQFEILPVPNVTLINTPTNGTCWEQGEVLNFTIATGTINAITSLTAGLTGTTSGLGTANATFTVVRTFTTQTLSTIRVTNNTGNFTNFNEEICAMLPPITNTIDDPNNSTDDSANLPPSSISQCVGIAVDVLGPSFPSGDVTWSIINSLNIPVVAGVNFIGQNTASVIFTLNDTVPAGNYTLIATETAVPANVSTHSFTLVALPPITVGSNQPYVGGNTQFATTFLFPVIWSPAEVDAVTGLATWTSSGVKVVTYNPAFSVCPVTLSFTVYNDITIAEYNGVDCIYINSGGTQALTVTGGSGSYTYSITGQNSISATGVVTAGIYAGNYTVSITDATANIIKNVPICIGSQTQFCTAIESTVCSTESEPCCELSVNCGETISLSIPSFHIRVNGIQQEVVYTSYGTGTTGPGGYLKSGLATTDASGNKVNCFDKEALFEIITSLDMADVANAPFGIGFSKQDGGPGVNSIGTGIVWYTSAGVRKIEVRQMGIVVPGSTFNVAQGDVVSGGFINGQFVVYINNLLRFETTDYECCGEQFLDVSIEQPNKSLGGNLNGLTWTITTPGSLSSVGTINASGVYNSPLNGTFSLVEATASVGNATFRVRIRNIKPTVKYTDTKAFLAGKAVTLWVGPYMANMNEPIRLAKDGSPDAIQNPDMIDTGVLEGSANFQEAFDYQDFENDLGQIYNTSLIKESATLTAVFLEVRDLYKMSKLKPEGTLYSKNRGVTEFGVGGKSCDVKELRVIMVIGQPGCDDQYDVLYLPRVQNKGNLGLEVGKKTNGKFELSITALPDYSRPSGRQLYSLYQIDSCGSETCN